MGRLGLVPAPDELACDWSVSKILGPYWLLAAYEDPGHGATASELTHVVLDLTAVLVILNLLDLDLVLRDVVLLQHVPGLDTEGTVTLGDDKDRLAGNLLIHQFFDTHDFYYFSATKK